MNIALPCRVVRIAISVVAAAALSLLAARAAGQLPPPLELPPVDQLPIPDPDSSGNGLPDAEPPPDSQPETSPEERELAQRTGAESKQWLAEMDAEAKSFRERAAGYLKRLAAQQKMLQSLRTQRAAVLRDLAAETRRSLLAGEKSAPDVAAAFSEAQEAELELLVAKAPRLAARQRQVQSLEALEAKIQGFLDAKDARFTRFDLLKAKSARLRAQIDALLEATPETRPEDVEAMLEQVATAEELYRYATAMSFNGTGMFSDRCQTGRSYYALRAQLERACGDDDEAWHGLTKAAQLSHTELQARRVAWEGGVGPIDSRLAAQHASAELWKALHQAEARLGKPLTPVPKETPPARELENPREDFSVPDLAPVAPE